ncbi:MAG: NAD(P)H-binding protein, partial [Actinobacteria bacterium]|nr:NAD(P)H-binding protein [Actinomycetota bacterium]
MKVFVTGASGWVASAVIPELLAAGQTVSGLARSDASAAEVERRGALAVRGSLGDVEDIAEAAAAADAVVHLAFPHENMNDIVAAAAIERVAIEALVAALAGSGKPLIAASGTPTTPGRPSTEDDSMISEGPTAARGANELLLRRAADRGV